MKGLKSTINLGSCQNLIIVPSPITSLACLVKTVQLVKTTNTLSDIFPSPKTALQVCSENGRSYSKVFHNSNTTHPKHHLILNLLQFSIELKVILQQTFTRQGSVVIPVRV